MRTIVLALTLVSLACAFRIPSLRNDAPYGGHSVRSVETSCTTYITECVGQGGDCTFNYTSGIYPLCLEGTCSADVCPTVPGLGATCTTTCTFGLSCHPFTKLCVKTVEIKPPGSSCTSDNQCLYSSAGASDARSSCVSGACYGIAIGGSCTGANQCNGRSYCGSSGTCVALRTVGQSCTSTDDLVAAGVCNSGTVIRSYSVSAGSSCTSGGACADGLYCPSSDTGSCTSNSGDGTACLTDSDCSNSGKCQCNGAANTTCYVPAGSISGESEVALPFLDCIDSKGCNPNDYSCATSQCPSQYCAYRTFVLKQYSGDSSCSGQYFYNGISTNLIPAIDCSTHSLAAKPLVSLALVASTMLATLL